MRWTTHKSYTRELNDIPDSTGVYAFYGMLRKNSDDHMLIYIGSSVKLKTRMKSYNLMPNEDGLFLTDWGKFYNLVAKTSTSAKIGEHLMREYRLIQRLSPFGNRAFCRRRD